MAVTINGTTGVSGVDGSAATPAYQGTTTNTGVTFPAASTVAISTAGNERARIDNLGNFIFGGVTVASQSAPSAYFSVAAGDGSPPYLWFAKTFNGNRNAILLNYNGTYVGGVDFTNTAATFVTSSDYRLKENVQPMQNTLATIALLNPVTYTWKVDGTAGEGFIAHELQAVIPDAVTGQKDAVDTDGKPIYQGVDYSKIVVHLVAAIQELKAEIDALKGGA